jgi:hypothetical protein
MLNERRNTMNQEVTSISSSSVLVDLNIAIWTERKNDKRVSEEIDIAKNTKARAGNFHKKLFAGDNALDEIQKFVTQVRTYHYNNTLPWSDSGTRLLVMGRFMEYNTKMRQFETEFDALKNKFLGDYNNMITAAAFTLGELFNREDYPLPDVIAHKFYFKYEYTPVPQSGDFRVDISNEGIQELVGRYESQFDARVQTAMKDAWSRLHECLTRMSERLDYAEDENKKIFRDSLVDNAIELIDMLKCMNITNDPELEKSRKQLEKAMFGISAKELREETDTRNHVKSEVDDILKRMSF